ncbi:DivIVA domain-containing protein [Gardnerella vaginalis]|uniref:DivIVA domain-containing protein n=1 Tax=Gardnerella TaxID=2701 RepID=UPI0003FC0812|nr:DivIVA domain-containing protein [Gardnerella vaginalis]MDK7259971.1 DivIVA domain-containing protein [Gardnerella vaginalis]MDK8776272.1 DivIVA domain-containing protein [Gardnerella vaginalis]
MVTLLTPQDVKNMQFAECPGFFGMPNGYDEYEVDQALEKVQETIEILGNEWIKAVQAAAKYRAQLETAGLLAE